MDSCIKAIPGEEEVMSTRPAGGGCAVRHVNGTQLGLGLDECAAGLLQLSGHILGNLALRGDGVTEIVSAAGVNSGGSEGFVTLH